MKIKRILALAAVILLIALYGSTIVFALSDSPNAAYLFKASIFCTVIIPVILYAYVIIHRIFNHAEPPQGEDTCKKNSDD